MDFNPKFSLLPFEKAQQLCKNKKTHTHKKKKTLPINQKRVGVALNSTRRKPLPELLSSAPLLCDRIQKPWLEVMSVPNEENLSSQSQLPSHFFWDLLDSIIVDVASECHRVAKLGLDANLEEDDEELKLSAQARVRVADPSNNSNEANGKYVVDIFGQTHPTVANEIFECMNCGRSIAAGRFAPHLEKCMGKGRKARLKVTRSSTGAQNQNRHSRGSSVSTHTNHSSNNSSANRLANGNPSFAGEEHSNGTTHP